MSKDTVTQNAYYTFKYNSSLGRHGWLRLTPAYSVRLVEEILLSLCQNRSVFTAEELKGFWAKHRYNLKILKFIYVKNLTKRLTLGYLWDHDIIPAPGGPRPFTAITDAQFDMIVQDSKTEIDYVE